MSWSARSPRTWGWTASTRQSSQEGYAFPTHVGMDRGAGAAYLLLYRVPHARGDGPRDLEVFFLCSVRSPRTWGWTVASSKKLASHTAFPTHVGMDRHISYPWSTIRRVPHARGDGPESYELAMRHLWRSPRTWGWTTDCDENPPEGAFPTHVGMDRCVFHRIRALGRVPHARGDGPWLPASSCRIAKRSPRTWGWTGPRSIRRKWHLAFPTHVGMDRPSIPITISRPRVPHARGDGPRCPGVPPGVPTRSPRTWGWTVVLDGLDEFLIAFPTHVGMDRCCSGVGSGARCVPHARGDGPRWSAYRSERWWRSPRTWGWTVDRV